MTEVDFKEKCRIYYMVKGDLTRTHRSQIEGSYESFFKRLWGNEESYLYEKGFEENFKDFIERESSGRPPRVY